MGSQVKIQVNGVAHNFWQMRRGLFTETPTLATRVFDQISLDVRDQEFLSIVGPSGCGKTTLLKILGGLISPSAGEVRIDGREAKHAREMVAFVFQHTGLLPWRDTLSNVAFGKQLRLHRRLRSAERADLGRWLELVGLRDASHMMPAQLSGGMQQRVGLARALSTEASVLLMDEPFGALDAQTRSVLQRELLALHASYQATVVFVTHDIEEALLLSDRVVVMTGQPARINRCLEVPFARHDRNAVRTTQAFAEAKANIWHLLDAGMPATANVREMEA